MRRRYRPDHGRVVRRDTELVIEGFPRSGNTFAIVAFQLAQPQPMKTAHHLHAPAQILESVDLNVPCLLLIREPIDAVASQLMYRGHEISAGITLWSWRRFYDSLRKVRPRVVVADLTEVSSDFGAVIRRLNERYRTTFAEFMHTAANEERVFAEIEEQNRRRYGRIREDRVARPSRYRDEAKAAVLAELMSPKLAGQRDRASELYRWWVG